MHLFPHFQRLLYNSIHERDGQQGGRTDGQTPHDGIGGAYAYRRGEIKAEMLIDSTECYVCLQGSEDGEHHVGRVTAEYQVDR